MDQKQLEQFAFMYLCGDYDRNLLSGKEEMTFTEFNRLLYLTELLGLNAYHSDIWNTYGVRFKEQFRRLEQLYGESCSMEVWSPMEDEEQIYAKWIGQFLLQLPKDCSKSLKDQIIGRWEEAGMDIDAFPVFV